MDPLPVEFAQETGQKRVFAWAIDWPGWCRSGRTADLAREALVACAPRYALVAAEAGLEFPADAATLAADVSRTVDSVPGGSGTDFGVPSAITELDHRPTTIAEAERLARIVEAAWAVFDRVAAAAPAELRKGPRGGGRDRDKMIGHVVGADHIYAQQIGLRGPEPSPGDRAAVAAERRAMLEVLRRPSDGVALAGRRWTARYAARRIAWHALDHAWEMEDRSEPTGAGQDHGA
jgi:hypothetical protein